MIEKMVTDIAKECSDRVLSKKNLHLTTAEFAIATRKMILRALNRVANQTTAKVKADLGRPEEEKDAKIIETLDLIMQDIQYYSDTDINKGSQHSKQAKHNVKGNVMAHISLLAQFLN